MIASDCVSTRAVVERERGHEALRVQRQIVLRALLALAQVHGRALVGRHALQFSAMRTRYAADERK